MASNGSTTDALIAKLTETIAGLNATIAKLASELEEQRRLGAAREAELEALKRKVFGKKTEKMPRPKDAMRKADGTKPDPKKRIDRRRANVEARAEIPTEIETHMVAPEDSSCPACGDASKMKPLGDGRQTTEYDYVPGYFRRRIHVQQVLACTCGRHVVTAPAPLRVYDRCQYGAGFIAHLVVAKCADSIPLYRLEKAYARVGIPISRSSMNELFHRSAEILRPIYDRLLESMREAYVVHADETPLLMQKRAKKGYVWTFRANGRTAYVFSAGRGGETPRQVLGGTKGVLVVDAYTGYNAVLSVDGRVRAGCLAHVRRKFFEALSSAPEVAQQALDLILALYRIEQIAKDRDIVGTADHGKLREAFGRPAMTRFLRFLREHRDDYPPRSPFGRAVRHALRNWRAITLYLRDTRIPIDNNPSERALRVVALGRKNFLFVGDVEAGSNLTVLYSLVASCEEAGVNPHAYLADVLMRVQTHPARAIDELLPDQWTALRA